MSTVTTTPTPSSAPIVLETARVRNWKPPIAFAVFALLFTILVYFAPRGGETTFRLATGSDFIELAPVVADVSFVTVASTIAMWAIALVSAGFTYAARKTPLWLMMLFAAIALIAFLTWAAAGAVIPVPGLLVGTIGLAAPLIFGAMGGVISERSGVVNIAIEGQLLAGAFSSAVVASMTGSPFAGLFAAVVAGVLVSFVLAAFSIKYLVDQVIVGVVLNVLVTGLTSFLFTTLLAPNAAFLNTPPRFPRLPIPGLSEIPLIGPIFFRQTIIIYFMYVAVFVIWFAMYKTKWGLRTRSVGEHPKAADTVGINVNSTRFWNVSLAGAVAGFGGAFFTLGSVGAFNKEMTAGAGFIALAAVIFGRWDPIRATLAALLFGFASNLQSVLSIIGSPVPSEFMLMLPYVVTIFAVAGLVGYSRAPAADGVPYVKS